MKELSIDFQSRFKHYSTGQSRHYLTVQHIAKVIYAAIKLISKDV